MQIHRTLLIDADCTHIEPNKDLRYQLRLITKFAESAFLELSNFVPCLHLLSVFSPKMSLNLRSNTEIYLIGFESEQILGAKLPTARQVLQTFFYNRRTVRLSLKASAKLVMEEVLVYWEKARIKTREFHHCKKKILDLHTKWEHLQKGSCRKTSEAQKKYEEQFIEDLDKLFDIAHADALNQMKEEDAEFLINQRKPNREGSLAGVDIKTNAKEKRRAERLEKEYLRKKKYEEECERSEKGNNDFFNLTKCTDFDLFSV